MAWQRTKEKYLTELLAPTVQWAGCVLWGCEWFPGRHAVLRVYIEKKDGGISLDDCQNVTKQIGPLLDVENVLPGSYNLEVSSPGERRPIFTVEQLKLYRTAQIRVQLSPSWQQRNCITGIIQDIDEAQLQLQASDQHYTIPVSLINKVHLWPEKRYTC